MVTKVDPIEEKRLARAQASAPLDSIGGGSSGSGAVANISDGLQAHRPFSA